MINMLLLFWPVAWCSIRSMVQRDELAEIEGHKLIERKGIAYRRKMLFFTTGEPFTGTGIWRCEDGSKMEESPYVNGKEHGMLLGTTGTGRSLAKLPTWTTKCMARGLRTARTDLSGLKTYTKTAKRSPEKISNPP